MVEYGRLSLMAMYAHDSTVKIAGHVLWSVPYLEKKYKHMFISSEIEEGLTQNLVIIPDDVIDDLDKWCYGVTVFKV